MAAAEVVFVAGCCDVDAGVLVEDLSALLGVGGVPA